VTITYDIIKGRNKSKRKLEEEYKIENRVCYLLILTISLLYNYHKIYYMSFITKTKTKRKERKRKEILNQEKC